MAEGYDAAIPLTLDRVNHPLCAVYRRTCLPSVEQALSRGTNKVIDMLLDGPLSIRWVNPDEGRFQDADLANINTPEDLRKLQDGVAPEPGSILNM